MKLTVRVEELRTALAKAKLTVSPNDTNAVLQNFALRAENDQLTVIATDLQLATVCQVPAAVDRPGATTLPGVKLLSIVETTSADILDIDVDLERHTATILSGAYTATLATLPFDDYPRIEDFHEDIAVKTDRVRMLEDLRRISFSVSDNEAKRNLLAVYLDNGLMQASDGQITTVVDFDPKFNEVLIPALAVKDLIKVLQVAETPDVALCSTDSFLLFKLGPDLFMTRLSTAKFPDIPKKIIAPTDKNRLTLKCDRAKLAAALRRVAVTASEKSLAVCFDVLPNNGASKLKLSANDLLGNASYEELDAEYSDPAPLKLYFNWSGLGDILNALKLDTVEFRISDNRKIPVRIEEKDPKFLSFIMRLSEQVLAQPVTPTPGGPAPTADAGAIPVDEV